MNFKTLLLATFLSPISVLFAQHTVSGTVYEDLNKNGKKERKEKGIANVQISNGTDVVSSDANGNYKIFVPEDAILFVIKPSGYQFALDQYNLPQFYYINKPNGSPTLKYGGVKPTGKLPKTIHFGLHATHESDQFTSFVFGDPQAYTQQEIQFFIDGIIKEVNANQALFGISLGDLVGDDLVLHPEYKKAIQQLNLPWYNVMGNHDMDYDATTDEHADETFESNFGPNNYSFNYGKVHFIVLDNILYPDPRDGKGYWGGLRKDQLQFIENDLKFVPKDNLIVLAFHIPLLDNQGAWFRVEDRARLFELLKDFPNTLSLSAHTHLQQQIFYEKEQDWPQPKPHHEFNVGTTSGDWYSGLINQQGVPTATMRDGTPKGYALIHFNGNQYEVDYKVAGASAEYQINIFTPKTANFSNPKNKHFIYANFFMGKKGDAVLYRIDQGAWKKMNFVLEPDPAYVSHYFEWDSSEQGIKDRRPSQAMQSTHLWRASIPNNLDSGIHTVEIKATNMFGKTATATTTFSVVK